MIAVIASESMSVRPWPCGQSQGSIKVVCSNDWGFSGDHGERLRGLLPRNALCTKIDRNGRKAVTRSVSVRHCC
jgi:hypothetical protein